MLNTKNKERFVRLWNWYYKSKDPIKPVSPILSNKSNIETVIAKNQSQYTPLLAIRINDRYGTIITRWKFDFLQRLILLLTGNLYIHCKTFYKPVQPLHLDLLKPNFVDPEFDKKLKVTEAMNIEMKQQMIATRDFLSEYINRRWAELMHGGTSGVETNSSLDKLQ